MITVEEETNTSAASASGDREVVVAARGLTKVFRDFWGRAKAHAVNDVDFEVRRGEVLGLLGPNGSGKTTTVKMLLGLLYPTKGHIEVFGKSPRHVATKARIGYLPEESYLYRYLNSEETLRFFGNLFKIEPKDLDRRIEQLIDMVGLGRARNRLVGEFSKGMQRRIGLAQALINDPDLVILDEPTAGMDPIGCREVKDLIVALAQRGKTVILSSHLLADVEDVCDRVVVYYGGRVRAMGTLKELLVEPDTLQITTPVLPKETVQEVLKIIRRDIEDGVVRVDNPTQNLESYFLNVVKKAKETDAQTSGATSGAQVAAYLRGDGETVKDGMDKVLDRLTASADSKAEKPVASEPAGPRVNHDALAKLAADKPAHEPKSTTTPEPAAPKVDHEKLAKLSGGQPAEEKSEEQPKQDPTPKPQANLDQANDKLSSLLGDQDKDKQ